MLLGACCDLLLTRAAVKCYACGLTYRIVRRSFAAPTLRRTLRSKTCQRTLTPAQRSKNVISASCRCERCLYGDGALADTAQH